MSNWLFWAIVGLMGWWLGLLVTLYLVVRMGWHKDSDGIRVDSAPAVWAAVFWPVTIVAVIIYLVFVKPPIALYNKAYAAHDASRSSKREEYGQ